MWIFLTLIFLLCAPLTASATLLLSADYEGGLYGGVLTCSGTTCPSGFPSVGLSAAKQIISSPAPRAGSGAAKMILLPTYSNCFLYDGGPYSGANCDRSEFEKMGLTNIGDERWYGISIYIDPSYTDTSTDPNGTVLTQWHDTRDSCEITKSPHLYIGVTKAPYHWRVRNQSDPNPCTTDPFVGRVDFDLGAVTTGVWVDFVVHAKWSYTSTGLLEIWKDGVKVIDRPSTPNTYNDTQPQNWKWGPYKAWWLSHTPAPTDQLVVYYDQIKLGDEHSSYDEVAPGVATPIQLAAPSDLRVVIQ